MERIDDVINVAGHRLSTGEMEEIVGAHPAVAECAVIGVHDELKGQLPLGLVVLKNGMKVDSHQLELELVGEVRDKIGGGRLFSSCCGGGAVAQNPFRKNFALRDPADRRWGELHGSFNH
jgi:acyl-CoA synthetase (AMP-forming)/AMP-acid ligase II